MGLDFTYAFQEQPRGLADVFLIGKEFIANSPVAMTSGDNIFYGRGLIDILQSAAKLKRGAQIFTYLVKKPQQFSIFEIDKHFNAVNIVEKPFDPKSNLAIPGIFFYDKRVCNFAQQLKPSRRGGLEITDPNNKYLFDESLKVNVLGRGIIWLDVGMHESLLQASNFVQAVEERQGLMISCPEEIAYRMGFIDKKQLIELANELKNNPFGDYLLNLVRE